MPHPNQIVAAALFVVLGELMFASMGVAVRFAATELPNEVIVFFRNLIGLLLLAPYLHRRGIQGVATRVAHLHLLRGLAGVAAMYCFYYAIAHMPLADAMLLKLTAPVFMPLIALIWLGEALSRYIWAALALGFGGVLLILHPGLHGVSPVAAVAVLGGLFAALAKVTVRRLARTEPPARTVFYFSLSAAVVSSVPLTWAWRTPSPEGYLWLFGVAGCATLGQLFLTQGLTLAPASRVAIFGYFAVIFGALYGWVLWDEALLWSTVAGSVLILTSALIATRRGSHATDGAVTIDSVTGKSSKVPGAA